MYETALWWELPCNGYRERKLSIQKGHLSMNSPLNKKYANIIFIDENEKRVILIQVLGP